MSEMTLEIDEMGNQQPSSCGESLEKVQRLIELRMGDSDKSGLQVYPERYLEDIVQT